MLTSLPTSRRCLLLIAAILFGTVAAETAKGDAFVQIQTNIFAPKIYLQLYDDRPLTQANFLSYVNADEYNSSYFHRLAQGFVLQGGGYKVDGTQVDLDLDGDGDPTTGTPTVPNEFSNPPYRSNLIGTVAMAKVAGDPDSATSEWFFNLDDNSGNLDYQNGGFTVFGRVIRGMDVVWALAYHENVTLYGELPIYEPDGGGQYYEMIVDASQISIENGDLNVDGQLTFAEVATTVANIGLTDAWWWDGDFNGDWVVDVTDGQLAVAAYNAQNPLAPLSLDTLMAVPEPASAALLLAGTCLLLRRRR